MLSNRQRKNLTRIVKRGLANRVDPLQERWNWRQAIDHFTVDGMIAICRSGHDCDHCYYESARNIPAPISIYAFLRDENEHRAYLDGPECMWLDFPNEQDYPCYVTRDVAAELAGY